MTDQQHSDLIIKSLRGGMVDTDAPSALADDECVLAENIEFFTSELGERRNGCGPIDITNAGFEDESTIVHISQWYPANDVIAPEFIVAAATPTVSVTLSKCTNGTWSEMAVGDAINTSVPDIYEIKTQSLNGKLFMAYHSAVDRLHVWDGTALRRAGLTQPDPPTGAAEGGGAYSGVRYFRMRYRVKSGDTIVVRSEPSTSLTFTPGGAAAGVTITKPATINEGETHWELEASLDDANYYLVTTLAVATTTYNDEVAYATGYSSGTLSEDVGTYLLLPSAKFLAVDGDRLIFAGHWTDKTKQCQIGWTPVYNDPGVGNDERLPLSVDNTVNIDNYDGGPITGIAASGNGTWYAFKWSAIYKMVRTGDITRAYDVLTISKIRGAVPGSIIRGTDENGSSCVYFLDPVAGPSRIGVGGLVTIVGLRGTWNRINLQAASVVARGCYYPYKQQIHWWIAVDGADRPNLKLVLQVSEVRPQSYTGGNGVGRGWSIATGRIAEATAVGVLTETVSIDGTSSISNRPVIGLTSPDYLQRCDTESTDAGTAYTGILRTRPYLVTGLLNRWGAMAATLLAASNATPSLIIKLIRDLGVETVQLTTGLAPVGSETFVIKRFDNLAMSDATTIQVEFTES